MGSNVKLVAKTLIFCGKVIFVFAAGSIVFHMIVMLVDYFLMIKPLSLNLHQNFPGSMISVPMLPMLVAYGLLSLVMYYLWEKSKTAVLYAREKKIQSENAETVLKSMQRLTGIMVEHIASQNSEIMSWVEFRKKQGRPVSQKVETSNKNIAKALQSLSELSFVSPYTKDRPRNVFDFEETLQNKLRNVSR
jgi:hypothetical protein